MERVFMGERGHKSPEGTNLSKSPQALGSWVHDFLQELGRNKPPALKHLSEAWVEAAGPAVAPVTRVRGFKGGTLMVSVASPALKSELEAFRHLEVLDRLKALLPNLPVQDVHYRLESL
jgi:hypothetical protein